MTFPVTERTFWSAVCDNEYRRAVAHAPYIHGFFCALASHFQLAFENNLEPKRSRQGEGAPRGVGAAEPHARRAACRRGV